MLFAFTDLLTNEEANKTAADFVRDKIKKIVRDKETAEKLCPNDHPIGTKRLCLDSNYFETYNKENVSLIDISNHPIQEITDNGLITNNIEYSFDDLVFATGFDAMTGAVNAIEILNEKNINALDNSIYYFVCVNVYWFQRPTSKRDNKTKRF